MSKALELLAARLEKINSLKIYTENLPSLKKASVDNLKTNINRYFEDLWKQKVSFPISELYSEFRSSDKEIPHALRDLYYISNVQLHTVNSCKKQLNKIDKDYPGHPYSSVSDLMREIIDQIAPYVEIMDALKSRLEYEKSQPKEPKDPVLRLPAPALASIRRIEAELRNNVTKIGEQIKLGAINSYKSNLELFNARPVDKKGRNCFNNALSFGRQLLPFLEFKDGYYQPVPDFESVIYSIAEKHSENVINDYISKHSYKLASIIEKMQDVSTIVVKSSSKVNCIEGNTYLTFESGKSFRVFSQIVQVWNVDTPFTRYPTTFHDVKNADGSHFGTMVSLEDMINWADNKDQSPGMTI